MNTKAVWMGLVAAAAGVWVSVGSGCIVEETNKSGSGGAGGAIGAGGYVTDATTGGGMGGDMTTGGGMGGMQNEGCTEVPNCKKCSACTMGCGVIDAAKTSVCNCNDNADGKASLDLYSDYLGCLCGADGMTGACGAKCSKTCLGTGTDSGDCMNCLGAALGSTCKDAFTACGADK